jgi:hypothetical protein
MPQDFLGTCVYTGERDGRGDRPSICAPHLGYELGRDGANGWTHKRDNCKPHGPGQWCWPVEYEPPIPPTQERGGQREAERPIQTEGSDVAAALAVTACEGRKRESHQHR